ncbi:MAG: CoA ester lyase [Proteobacteria bacterium]|nr:CoA ester lyase [Pseudomonadota bacterium]
MSVVEPRPRATFLRRSAHFVPGASEKMLLKSIDTAADALVLDLEDAVVPDLKSTARSTVSRWLRDVDFQGKERMVRMNPLATPWGVDDLEETMEHPPDTYMVPKVSSLDELNAIDARLRDLEQRYGHPLGQVGLVLVSTETPLGALNLPTFTRCRRVVALSWGAEDLSAALGAPRNRRPDGSYLSVYEYCRTITLLCAAAGNVQPLDTVFTDFKNPDGLAKECQESAWLGYTGKITIHPAQIDIVNTAFTPSDEQVAEARRLLAAFDDAQAQGKMAFSFDGQMVDVPHLTRAQKIVERANMIKAKL